jgi:WD40 repeat protein
MQLWDIPTGKQVRSFQGGSGSLSPDGKTLATWDQKTNASRLWELSSEKVITLKFDEKRDPVLRFLREETPPFDSVGVPAFHPNSDTVATVGAGILRLWDRKTGRFQAALDPHVALDNMQWCQVLPEVIALARNVQYRKAKSLGVDWLDYYVAEGGLAGRSSAPLHPRVRILEHIVALRVESRPSLVPGPWATPFASFSPDGRLLAYRFGGKALLCRVRDGGLLFALEGRPLSFSPDSKKLATATRGGTRLWDVASGKPILNLGGGDSFFPDGRTMYSGPWFSETHEGRAGRVFVQRRTMDSGAKFWDARTGREQGAFNGYEGGGLAFSIDGKTLVCVSGAKATLWDAVTAVKTDVPGKATVAPDGKSVALETGASIKLHSPPSRSLPL